MVRKIVSYDTTHSGLRATVLYNRRLFFSDVAQAIVNCAKDPDTAGQVYQDVGPKRYLLSALIDWFHRVMRKDDKWWGHRR
ncbi:PREDICTED: NADH dehydrogenase [ubiquinone] 1 alpha subcomplex subunit 9, mitochondrial-like [Bactrocera latifrons]|uniref:NADH dehydrogenase [ubiquinone] 1 alpha subcomplex subunit 9, mitochondrial-like n=1 Tax=Bactrocera latifrons TaxID=174628 RepID=UPI0008DD5E1B|nr:PREDICTED: NADH dehydrogenase [ubiquinone] 1 alpha subcomplex subunit 9, mitochondrial-like [Bactrocera latifrons]